MTLDLQDDLFGAVAAHLAEALAGARVRPEPFAHLFVENVFPADFYARLLDGLPPTEAYAPLAGSERVGEGYNGQRYYLQHEPGMIERLPEPIRDFWRHTLAILWGDDFARALFAKFGAELSAVFTRAASDGTPIVDVAKEMLLVRDLEGYDLGPHTDAPPKILTALFYLARDENRPNLGTTLFRPKQPGFTCAGGPHYPFEEFDAVATCPYLPNSLFAFVRSDVSFHGVMALDEGEVERDLIIYVLKKAE